MSFRSLIFGSALLIVGLVFSTTATAQSGPPKTPIDLSAGLKGGVAMSAMSEVPDLNLSQRVRYHPAGSDDSGFYPGFGAGAGFGLALEARAWHVVGLETGFYYRLDDATGWNDKTVNGVDRGRVFMDQDTSALHIPLLLKLISPNGTVKPFVGLGADFVLQQSSDLDYRSERDRPNDQTVDQYEELFEAQNRISTSSYTMLELTTGVEIDLGDFYIPIELRAGYNVGWDDSFDSRVDPQKQSDGSYNLVYDGQYWGHFAIYTGVMYDFDLML